jgi:hypothetical protein
MLVRMVANHTGSAAAAFEFAQQVLPILPRPVYGDNCVWFVHGMFGAPGIVSQLSSEGGTRLAGIWSIHARVCVLGAWDCIPYWL